MERRMASTSASVSAGAAASDSAMTALRGKTFYCRRWAFEKLRLCLDKRPMSSTCGTLIVSDSGGGKTALCSELVWPTVKSGPQVELSRRMLAYHFCLIRSYHTLSLKKFLISLAQQLLDNNNHLLPDGWFPTPPSQPTTVNNSAADFDADEYFLRHILGPLKRLQVKPKSVLYLLVDALDESDDGMFHTATVEGARSQTIAQLLSRHYKHFPDWLALVCSCSSRVKRVTRMFTGFRKLTLDDVARSYVTHDVQQYILHRLDSESALRRLLNRDTAEILDKLHVKSNGCLLYIELVLDLVGRGSVTLQTVRDIPGTLYGLYMWCCQTLCTDQVLYERITRRVFNILLAAREPPTIQRIYDCLLTRDNLIQLCELEECLASVSQLVMLTDSGDSEPCLIFMHGSFRIWLQDVKFCSANYHCSAREGHEMLALYYTLRAPQLNMTEVHEFAYHLQKCNTTAHSSGNATTAHSVNPNHKQQELSARSTSNIGNRVLEISEQAVWMLLSGARLDSTTDTVMTLSTQSEDADASQLDSTKVEEELEGDISIPADPPDESDTAVPLPFSPEDVNLCDSTGQTPLVSASSSGQLPLVQALVEHGHAEINLPDSSGRTPLRAASSAGCEDVVRYLLNNDADVNRPDTEGRSPLLAACYMGHCDIVEVLLSHSADVNQTDKRQRNPLAVTCLFCSEDQKSSANHLRVVELLIQSGCDVDAADKDLQTPLHLASFEGHLDICRSLVAASAQIDAVDATQSTPLLLAAGQGHAEVVNLLIASDSDIHHLDKDGRTALSLACLYGHYAIVNRFLELGQDEMHRDNFGVDCLHLSSQQGHQQVVQLLLEHDADPDSTDDHGRTSLYLASQHGHHEALNTLLSFNANPNIPAHNGKSCLRVACTGGHLDCVHALITHAADLSYIDMEGRPIVYVLAVENRPQAIRMLYDAGADINGRDNEGRTPLHVSSWLGHSDIVTQLLSLGADVDALDRERRTPLQSAVWQGHAFIAQILCEKGANVNHTCDQGATPLCIAAQEGFTQVVSTLCRFTADPNHCDKFGRTAFKIAMKQENTDMLRLLEDIMRQSKPSPRKSSHTSQSHDDLYENTALSDQSDTGRPCELVSPYAVNSVIEDIRFSHLNSPSASTASQPIKTSQPKKSKPGNQPIKSTKENQSTTTQISDQIAKVAIDSQSSKTSAVQQPIRVAAEKQPIRSGSGAARNKQPVPSTSKSHLNPAITSPENHFQPITRQYEPSLLTSSDEEEGLDTAPSSVSSGNRSSEESVESDEFILDQAEKMGFSQQIVRLRQTSQPSPRNIDDFLRGQVGHMANPRVRQTNADAIDPAGNSPSKVFAAFLNSPRKQGKQPISGRQGKSSQKGKVNKMAALQNTAREPAFKIQYAAGDSVPHLPASGYAVRNDELMSSDQSLSSVRSRQAKIVTNTRSITQPTSNSAPKLPVKTRPTPSQGPERTSPPPPVLPPRLSRGGQQSTPVLASPQSTSQQTKPTLVGVVRPCTQHSAPSPITGAKTDAKRRSSKKETSL